MEFLPHWRSRVGADPGSHPTAGVLRQGRCAATNVRYLASLAFVTTPRVPLSTCAVKPAHKSPSLLSPILFRLSTLLSPVPVPVSCLLILPLLKCPMLVARARAPRAASLPLPLLRKGPCCRRGRRRRRRGRQQVVPGAAKTLHGGARWGTGAGQVPVGEGAGAAKALLGGARGSKGAGEVAAGKSWGAERALPACCREG